MLCLGHSRHAPLPLRVVATSLALCLFAISAPPSDGHAQATSATTAPEPAEYRALVQEALLEFDAQHFEESRALFGRAHALFPNARTLRGLGFAEFELRNYPAAIEHLEGALRADIKPLTDDLRADTERVLARANQFVGRLRLDLKPSTAQLRVDGTTVDVRSGEPLLLQVGEHTLDLRAPGFLDEKRHVSVQGGEDKTLTIILARAETAPGTPQAERRWYKNPWLWAGVGLVVAGAAAGTGIALTREDKTASTYGGNTGSVLKGP